MNDLNVRIVYLPPATVASVHFHCDEPEALAFKAMEEFVLSSNLCAIKPDLRHYGFNHPNPSPDTPPGQPDHGYEMWVTIPEGMEVPATMAKKGFEGGLYAALAITLGDFGKWDSLFAWVMANPDYEPNLGPAEVMHGLLEEHLNYINHVGKDIPEAKVQLDLLLPIKPKA